MLIEYRTNKLKAICLEEKKAVKYHNKRQALKIQQRINEILAAPTLADLNKLPPTRCHLLKGKRELQFAVDLVHPWRLIFKPLGEKDIIFKNDVLDTSKVIKVIIWEIDDYHKK